MELWYVVSYVASVILGIRPVVLTKAISSIELRIASCCRKPSCLALGAPMTARLVLNRIADHNQHQVVQRWFLDNLNSK